MTRAAGECAPLLGAAGEAVTVPSTALSSAATISTAAAAAAALALFSVFAITGAFITSSLVLSSSAPPEEDRFLVGLLGPEGAGMNLQHIGCYAALAAATGRRFVLVPEYQSEHYKAHATEEPAVDYAEYLDVRRFPARALTWADAPAAVKRAVIDNPDKVLLGNIQDYEGDERDALSGFRYGPSPTEDYPHVSHARWATYAKYKTVAGKDNHGGPGTSEMQLEELRHMTTAADTTVLSASRMHACAPPPLEPTPYLAGLVAAALNNLRAAHGAAADAAAADSAAANAAAGDVAGGTADTAADTADTAENTAENTADTAEVTAEEDDGAGGDELATDARLTRALAGFPFAALHWRRGDRCSGPSGTRSRRTGAGHADAARCAAGGDHPVLERCRGELPLYIASDETDPQVGRCNLTPA